MSANLSVVNGAPAILVSDWRSAASLIDHTLLKPDATRDQVVALCDEAVQLRFSCGHGESGQRGPGRCPTARLAG